LSWHHFDPPWREKQHHNPDGMIALCLQHAKEADQGAFTTQQLKDMKKQPYLKELEKFPQGRFNWRREQLLLLAGGT
jgi:peptide deformylase